MMQGRLSGSDFSLNAVQANDEDGREWMDTLADEGPIAEETVAHNKLRKSLEKQAGPLARSFLKD